MSHEAGCERLSGLDYAMEQSFAAMIEVTDLVFDQRSVYDDAPVKFKYVVEV